MKKQLHQKNKETPEEGFLFVKVEMNQLQIHTPHFTVSSPVNELKQSCDSSGQQLILLSFAHNYHYVTFPV